MHKKWFLVAALILSLIFDKEIILFTVSLRSSFLNSLVIFFVDYIILFTAIAVLILFVWKKDWLLAFLASISATVFVTSILKILILRPRPFISLNLSKIPSFNYYFTVWNSSMPSLHAAIPFSVFPFIAKKFPKLKWYWFCFASLICFSRLYFGVHYLSDVIAGALLGYLIGFFILWFEEKRKNFIKKS